MPGATASGFRPLPPFYRKAPGPRHISQILQERHKHTPDPQRICTLRAVIGLMNKEIREQTHQARVAEMLSELDDVQDKPIEVDRRTGTPKNTVL